MPATQYLHSKLEHGPRPTPSFCPQGFRVLKGSAQQAEEDEPKEARRFSIMLKLDGEVKAIVGEMERLHRVIAELEIARELINVACGERQYD